MSIEAERILKLLLKKEGARYTPYIDSLIASKRLLIHGLINRKKASDRYSVAETQRGVYQVVDLMTEKIVTFPFEQETTTGTIRPRAMSIAAQLNAMKKGKSAPHERMTQRRLERTADDARMVARELLDKGLRKDLKKRLAKERRYLKDNKLFLRQNERDSRKTYIDAMAKTMQEQEQEDAFLYSELQRLARAAERTMGYDQIEAIFPRLGTRSPAGVFREAAQALAQMKDASHRQSARNILARSYDVLGEKPPNRFMNPQDSFHPARYYQGLTLDEKRRRKASFERRRKMEDDDPRRYAPMPKVQSVETVPSQYTELFHERFKNPETPRIKKALQRKSKQTGFPYRILREVFSRGYEAWFEGHRPGTNPYQWGLARVNSFAVGGPTFHTTDADLARQL